MKSRKSSDRRQLELDLPLNQPDSSPPSKPKLSKPLRSPRQGLDEELTRQSRELVIAVGLEDLAKQITVSWNSRLRTTAGRAYRNEQLVELNPALEQIEDAAGEVDRTLKHELAHLVAYYRAGRKRIEPHGREWRQACADLGIPDEERCHDLPFERTQQKRRYCYSCPNCDHKIFRVRKIRRAAACYDCCRTYNGGRFDARFELKVEQIRPDS